MFSRTGTTVEEYLEANNPAVTTLLKNGPQTSIVANAISGGRTAARTPTRPS